MPRLLILAGCLLPALLAFALPTLVGPTGLVVLPDALPAAQRLTVAGSVVENPGAREVALRGVIGLPHGEIGALYAFDDHPLTGANGKITLDTPLAGTFAGLGVIYLHNRVATERCAYAALTRAGRVSLTGGLLWTQVSTDVGKANATRPYAGVSVALPGGMTLVAEMQAASARFAEPNPLSSIMLVRPNGVVSSMVGVTNAAGVLGADTHYYFGGFAMAL